MGENILKSFDDDVYGRKIIAQNLTKIIESQDNSMVISLDSEWGTGKTTFVSMWKDFLDTDERYSSKFNTLYFNAWENDYIRDPLLALFSEIEVEVNKEGSKFKQNFQKVKEILLPMAKLVTKVGIKIGTAGFLDIDKIDLGDYTEETIMDLASKLGDLSIKEIVASKSVRTKFRETMSNYQKENDKKIIFFIDELDRCRPTFAIELLEVIKHLFNIDNCIFVISIDKEQLSHSVSTIYGQNMDTVGYLRRFFDLDYKLPSIDIKKYIDNKNLTILKEYKNIEVFKYFIKRQFELEKFSLRDIDKAYYYLQLLLPLIEPFNKENPSENSKWKSVFIATISYLYSMFVAVKIKNPILFNKAIKGDYNLSEIIKKFNIVNLIGNETYIDDWHVESLSEIIEGTLQLFLELNLIDFSRGIDEHIDRDKYMVGLERNGGTFYSDNRFCLLELFRDDNLNVKKNLEFVNGFAD